MSEPVTLIPIFYCIKNQSPALLFLLNRKKSRSALLLGPKCPCVDSLSLPTFCGLYEFKSLSIKRREIHFVSPLHKITPLIRSGVILLPEKVCASLLNWCWNMITNKYIGRWDGYWKRGLRATPKSRRSDSQAGPGYISRSDLSFFYYISTKVY